MATPTMKIRFTQDSLNLLLLAILLFIYAFLLVPHDGLDLYRHYERIASLKNLSLLEIISKPEPGYIVFDVYAWFTNKLLLPKEFFPASVVLFSYLLIFSMFKDIKNFYLADMNKTELILVFFTLFFSVNFVFLVSGIRSWFSAIVLLNASYYFFRYNKLAYFLVLSSFAFLIHPFSAVFSAIILVTRFLIPYYRFGNILVILCLCFIIFYPVTDFIMSYVVNILSDLNLLRGNYFDADGAWGGGYNLRRNLNGILGDYFISRLSIYIALLYLILERPIKTEFFYLTLCILSVYLGVFFFYYTLFERAADFFKVLFAVYISCQYGLYKNKRNGLFLLFYAMAVILNSIYHFYNHRDFLLSFT